MRSLPAKDATTNVGIKALSDGCWIVKEWVALLDEMFFVHLSNGSNKQLSKKVDSDVHVPTSNRSYVVCDD